MKDFRKKYRDFEDFLHEYYAEQINTTCLDDDLPDCTADWIGQLEPDNIIELADKFARAELSYLHKQYYNELDRIKSPLLLQ